MKELKFRAWVEKQGTDLRYFRYFGLNTMLPNDISVVAYNQYTGLLDKNGRKIYEGDVVRGNFKGGDKGKIEYHTAGFCVSFSHGCTELNRFYDLDNQPYEVIELEVIGNIWENPDLLKEAE